jgi:hypothetical protein
MRAGKMRPRFEVRQCSAAFDMLQSTRELSGSNQKMQEISAEVS